MTNLITTTCQACHSTATQLGPRNEAGRIFMCLGCLAMTARCELGPLPEDRLMDPGEILLVRDTLPAELREAFDSYYRLRGRSLPFADAPDEKTVESLILVCLPHQGGDPSPADGVLTAKAPNGYTFKFRRAHLELSRSIVKRMLEGLEREFRQGEGGGLSAERFAYRANGTTWTTVQNPRAAFYVDALIGMALALGLARYITPEDLWSVMPHGKPYVVLDL